MASDLDIAWAAGLFEGEGSCHVHMGRQPIAQLGMTDKDVVARFASIVGVGKVTGLPGRTVRHKRQWRWVVGSRDDVAHVLGLFWPYLGERRQEQAMVVLERCSKMRETDGFCKNGHAIVGDNVAYLHRKTGKLRCRQCHNAYMRGWKRKRSASSPAAT